MSTLTVTNGQVLLGTAAPIATDNYVNGVLTSATGGLNRATLSALNEYSNGLPMTDAGQLVYVDATAGLPVGTTWSNGLPFSGGALCISTNAVSTYSNGIPFAANGAVAAGIVP